MDPVSLLGTRAYGITVLDVDRVGAAAPHRVLFQITGEGIAAASWVHEYPDFAGLVAYLQELERDWRGWDGRREWVSLEGDLTITASHTGSHVELKVTLRRSMDWRVETELIIGAGEDVSTAARTAESALL